MGLEDVRQNEEAPCILEKQVDGVWSEFADLRLCAPNIRKNPETGELEYSTDDGETWTSFPKPPVPAREEEDDSEALCLAAANAANALIMTYEEFRARYATTGDVLALATYVFLLLGFVVLFPPTAIAIVPIVVAIIALGSINENPATTSDREALICALLEAATRTDGVVTFNLSEVQAGISGSSSIPLQAINLMLPLFGEDGLNRAGALTAITDEDCEFCAHPTFCYYTNWGVENDGRWTKYTTAGAYVTSDGWRGTSGGSSGDWEEVGIEFAFAAPVHLTHLYGGFFNEGAASYAEIRVNGTVVWDQTGAGLHNPDFDVDIPDALTLRYYVRCTNGLICRIGEASFSGVDEEIDYGDQNCDAV